MRLLSIALDLKGGWAAMRKALVEESELVSHVGGVIIAHIFRSRRRVSKFKLVSLPRK